MPNRKRGAPKPGQEVITLNGVPQAAQIPFFECTKPYIGYGGARGGGKSWALRRKAVLMCLNFRGLRVLMVRRTLGDLRENHIAQLNAELGNSVRYDREERAIYFPNASRIKFGYLDNDSDLNQYQGQEYDVVMIDEATQFQENEFRALGACVRGGNPNYPKRMYLTCNPGGVGHAWVKRLFIDRNFRPEEKPEDYAFFFAKATDNAYNGDGYMRQLDALPDKIRRAWRDGDWNVFTGRYFTEFDESLHVVEPFNIPSSWNRYYVNDYGLDALAGLWIAVSPEGTAFVYREIFEGKDVPEDCSGTGLTVGQAAEAVKRLETSEEIRRIVSRIAPPDLWSRSRDSGKSQIDIFAEHGMYFSKADANRINGWMALHEWLTPVSTPEGMQPRLKIFSNCKNLISFLPILQYDDKKNNDVATSPHRITHLPDALRYWAISNPCAPEIVPENVIMPFKEMEPEKDAISEWDGEVTDSYLYGGWDNG